MKAIKLHSKIARAPLDVGNFLVFLYRVINGHLAVSFFKSGLSSCYVKFIFMMEVLL